MLTRNFNFNTKHGLRWELVWTHHQLKSHSPHWLDVFINMGEYDCHWHLIGSSLSSVPCWAAPLEYSGTVNSFIESEALTPLKPAEHPGQKSTQSSAAFRSLSARVQKREREREAAHVAHMRHKFNVAAHLCKPALCLCSVSSHTANVMLGLLWVTVSLQNTYWVLFTTFAFGGLI